MNHHSRSYSEQPQIASSAVVAGFNNGAIPPQSFVLEHSNSKQSLDELFNPPQIRSALPWRNRNLPSSFFNPSVKADGESNGGGGTNGTTNINLHNRSVSFDQRSNPSILRGAPGQGPNFHMRTHSTLAPMPRLDSNQSSHQSSHEFLNQNQNASSTNGSTTNVSSCPQHSENIVSSTSTNNHNNHNHHHHHDHQQQQRQHQTHQTHQQPHQLHHHTHSNGWSSAGNSVDDLSSPSWASGGQSQPQSQLHQVPAAPQTHVHAEHAIHLESQQQQQASFLARSHQHHHQQPQHAFVYNGASNDMTTQNASADSVLTPMRVQPTTTNHLCPNHSLHARSMSYQQRPAPEMRPNPGFHMRTHSTVAPISTCQHHQPQLATIHHHSSSSHQSSQEFLNHSSATNTSATTGWSSSGYSTDDMTSTVSNGGWAPGHAHSRPHQHQGSQSQLHITQQPLPQPPTMDHHPIVPTSVNASTALPLHNHHHNHIPMQAPHQTAHQAPQQLFYNV